MKLQALGQDVGLASQGQGPRTCKTPTRPTHPKHSPSPPGAGLKQLHQNLSSACACKPPSTPNQLKSPRAWGMYFPNEKRHTSL